MKIASNQSILIKLDVLQDLNEASLSSAATVSKTYSYAQRALHFQQKTWGNLIYRMGDALYHIFCQKVIVRVSNQFTGGWENQAFWVKGEQIARSQLFLEDPSPRRATGSDASIETIASDPGSPSSPKLTPSPFSEDEEPGFMLDLKKIKAELALRKAHEAMMTAIEGRGWLDLPQHQRIALNEALSNAKVELHIINQKYHQALTREKG